MLEKKCPSCGLTKPISEWGKNKASRDGFQRHCKTCRIAYNHDHYEKTKDRWKESRRRSADKVRDDIRDFLGEYLNEHPCVDCGNDDIRVLDFDHLRDKVMGVARMASYGNLDKVKEEVKKCEVRCRNCHQIKTYARIGGSWRCKFLIQNGSLV